MLIAEGSDTVLKCDLLFIPQAYLSIKSLDYTLFKFPIIYLYFSLPDIMI